VEALRQLTYFVLEGNLSLDSTIYALGSRRNLHDTGLHLTVLREGEAGLGADQGRVRDALREVGDPSDGVFLHDESLQLLRFEHRI